MTAAPASMNELVPLNELAARLPGRADYHTAYRWCRIGVGGVKLEHQWIGKRIYSTTAAVSRFIARVNEAQGNSSGMAVAV